MLTLLLLASRLSVVPPLSDPLGGQLPDSLQLAVPPLYLVLAPLFTLWDGISMLSMSRLHGFLVGLAGLYLIGRIVRHIRVRPPLKSWRTWVREIGVLLLSLGGLLAFIVAGAIWHRPMLSLTGVPWGYQVADFHSHTAASHDVGDTWMAGYDLAANLRWHGRAGFNVVFITDHNVVSRETRDASRESGVGSRASAGPIPCPGLEVSAWKAHIVLLGDTLPINRAPYSGLAGLLTLLRTSDSAYGSLSLASLPEYRRNHWERLDTLIEAGLDGFEIVNASPKANELTRPAATRVIDLARKNDLFVVGVSDSHGWGATSMVWNLVPVPSLARSRQPSATGSSAGWIRAFGWPDYRTPPAPAPTPAGRPGSPRSVWYGRPGGAWTGPLALSWLVWIWGIAVVLHARDGAAGISFPRPSPGRS